MKSSEMRAVITLLTDFGTKDHYVSSMKGVILSINPKATIVDITHNIEPFNIMQAAFVLHQTANWFPKGTIHVVIVDPGVGSKRRAIAIKTKKYTFIGPDNGVLMPSANSFGIIEVREIKRKFFDEVSYTFHGRDVFAPAAASLSLGMKFEELGPIAPNPKELSFWKPKRVNNGLKALALHVDRFGNVITNIPRRDYEEIASKHRVYMELRGKRISLKPARSYFEGKPMELLILPGSGDFVEISCNRESAAKLLGLKPGDEFFLRYESSF